MITMKIMWILWKGLFDLPFLSNKWNSVFALSSQATESVTVVEVVTYLTLW